MPSPLTASVAAAAILALVPLAAQAQGQATGLPSGVGKALVEGLCVSCHQTNLITASSGYTRDGWKELIGTMIDLTRTAEEAAITQYLATHFPPNSRRAPKLVAGAAQTLNKYVQHMGLFGDSDLSSTRTVADTRRFGQALSSSMLHIVHHGTHHRYAQIPFYKLPAATAYVYNAPGPDEPVFGSYWAALMDMLPVLKDPRIGRQWLG